jgi:formate dehydrogenase family accessory protein FdhD
MASIDTWRSVLDPERVMEVRVIHWQEESAAERQDYLAVEEPLEIRIQHRSLAVIMRTPGHDKELALGFLLSEGVITAANDVSELSNDCDSDGLPLENVINVTLRPERSATVTGQAECSTQAVPATASFERHFAVSASCGLCGKNSIADLVQTVPPLAADTLTVPIGCLYTLAEQLRAQQAVFQHTGGLHAAALFTLDGRLQLLREDIGRHNAVDKLIGYGLLHATFPYSEQVLLVSGRTSFEIIQKALIARIPCIVAISAPSSLAVELADKAGITLIGFLRNRTLNVYTHTRRIV